MRDAAAIGVVVIAAPAGHESEFERIAGGAAGIPGAPASFHPIVVTGGDTRAASVGHALAEVPVATPIVAVHDAARPLASAALIDALVARLADNPVAEGVIAAAPVADTLKRVGEDGQIVATESREALWSALTPQVFRAEPLRRAHDGDPAQVASATDDAMLIERGGGTVLVEPAVEENFKVTTPRDLALAELVLARRGSA